jgi:hypothetical protein
MPRVSFRSQYRSNLIGLTLSLAGVGTFISVPITVLLWWLRGAKVLPTAIGLVAVLEADVLCWPSPRDVQHRHPVRTKLAARDLNDAITDFVDTARDIPHADSGRETFAPAEQAARFGIR